MSSSVSSWDRWKDLSLCGVEKGCEGETRSLAICIQRPAVGEEGGAWKREFRRGGPGQVVPMTAQQASQESLHRRRWFSSGRACLGSRSLSLPGGPLVEAVLLGCLSLQGVESGLLQVLPAPHSVIPQGSCASVCRTFPPSPPSSSPTEPLSWVAGQHTTPAHAACPPQVPLSVQGSKHTPPARALSGVQVARRPQTLTAGGRTQCKNAPGARPRALLPGSPAAPQKRRQVFRRPPSRKAAQKPPSTGT